MLKLKYLNPVNIINYILRIRRKPVHVTRKQLHDAYKSVFLSSPDGRIVLEHLAKIHFVGRQTYHPASDRESAYNEGRRYAIESIIHTISSNFEALEKLNEQMTNETNKLTNEEQ